MMTHLMVNVITLRGIARINRQGNIIGIGHSVDEN